MAEYICPQCQEPLKSRQCQNEICGLDLDTLFKEVKFEPAGLHAYLEQAGAFYDRGTKSLVVPRANGMPAIEVSFLPGKQGTDIKPLFWWFITQCGLPKKRFSPDFVQAYLSMFGAGSFTLPEVDYYGDRPQLFLRGDELYWPNPSTPQSRLVGDAGFYYTGPEITPCRTGLVEEFLASTKTANMAARDALKAWLVGTLLQSWLPPGGLPMLFLAANSNGAGKSTLANLLGYWLGGTCLIPWASMQDFDGIIRKSMDPNIRTLNFDNLTPPLGQQILHMPDVATLITQRDITTKTLFATRGATQVPNRCLYTATANQPIVSGEIFSRIVVVPLDKEVPSTTKWEENWRNKRNEILADLMALALENWTKGPLPNLTNMPSNYRFVDWYHGVSRILQQEPVLYPSGMTLVPPLDFVIQHALILEDVSSLSLADLVEFLCTTRLRDCRDIAQQRQWSEETIQEELSLYNSAFEVFSNEGGALCVRPKSGVSLPKKNNT